MYLKHLSLLNFRNYTHLEIDLPRGMVVFHGDNAQGKTNLMEAAYLLSIAKSFRAANEREVVNRQAAREQGQALVAGLFQTRDETLDVRIGFQCFPSASPVDREYQVRKRVRVNGSTTTASQVVGMAPAVLFSATDVDLVFGPPASRRRFLDILLSQVDRQYLRSLQRYQRVLAQRNQLLKLLREGHASDEETAFWDQELVKEGAFIMRRRREALASIAVLARERLRSLTRGEESLEVQYAPSTSYYEANQEQQAFDQALAANRDRERAVGQTLVGPHRDDVRFLVDEMDMGTYASRGQARSVALALRLAEAAHLANIKGEQPVLLLDDVLSELDVSRRQQVMEAAQAYEQALITTTDLNMLEGSTLASASLFRVSAGGVSHSNMTFRRGPRV